MNKLKNQKIVEIILVLIVIIVGGVGIYYYLNSGSDSFSSNGGKGASNVNLNESDYDYDFSSYEEVKVNLDSVKDVYEITSEGVYHFTGKLEGYIKVNTDKNVKIILDSVTINNDDGPCIYVENAKNTYIELVGESSLTSGSEYSSDFTDIDGCIYSSDDLIFMGDGTLNVSSKYLDGIVSTDDLVFKSGIYNITSNDDGIRGKDSVIIFDGKFTIKASGDGIKSTNSEDSSKGYVKIVNGTFNITANNDGIQAETILDIEDGEFNITTGNGAVLSGGKTGDAGMMWGGNNTTMSSDTESSKGIKAGSSILINGGKFTLDNSDDSIHSNGVITLNGGTYSIKSSDDGIHSDGKIEIIDGTFDISASEGIEATYVKIDGGTITISASDDGINAGNKSSDYTTTVEINGGTITIKMGSGDTDGIDSNGNIYINGGTIDITCNSPFDYDGEAKKTGGKLIVNGEETNTITNQMMGGGTMPGGDGEMPQQGGTTPPDGNQSQNGNNRGNRGGNRR